jgi:hypothetical protein
MSSSALNQTTSPDYRRTLTRIVRFRQIHIVLYCITFVTIASGLAVELAGLGVESARLLDFGLQMVAVGALLIMVLGFESCLALPFFKCPRCGQPLLTLNGLLTRRTLPFSQFCVNCHLSFRIPADRLRDPASEPPTRE